MMIAATRSCGVTGLKACTSDARLPSDVLIVVRLLELLARQVQRLPGREQRRRQPVGLEDRLHVRPRIPPVVGGGDAPDGVPRRDDDPVACLWPAAVGEPAGGEHERGGEDKDTAPAAPALGSRAAVSGAVLYEHAFVREPITNRRSLQYLFRTTGVKGHMGVLRMLRRVS